MANPLLIQVRQLRSRFDALERRDRFAVIGLAAFLSVLFLYFGIWSPSYEFYNARALDRDRELSLLQFMRASEAQARAASRATVRAPSGQSLLTQVSRSAQAFNINPNRLQPEGNDSVSVWFDGVAFNDLIRWLESQSAQGVFVRQVSIDRQEASGIVNARIVLRS